MAPSLCVAHAPAKESAIIQCTLAIVAVAAALVLAVPVAAAVPVAVVVYMVVIVPMSVSVHVLVHVHKACVIRAVAALISPALVGPEPEVWLPVRRL